VRSIFWTKSAKLSGFPMSFMHSEPFMLCKYNPKPYRYTWLEVLGKRVVPNSMVPSIGLLITIVSFSFSGSSSGFNGYCITIVS